jgi:signal peptidase II
MTARLRYLWITLAVVMLDRATKAYFEVATPLGWRHEVIFKFIYLVHSQNTGIAFGVFSQTAGTGTRIALIAGSLMVIAALSWLLVTSREASALSSVGLALLLGGATGNVTDRILHGAVTDFFEVLFGSYTYPAFNVADSVITIGAIMLLFDLLFARPGKPAT